MINLGYYPAYGHRLKFAEGKRPRTILWQMDPLPAEDWPAEALDVGLKAARWKSRFALYQSSALPRWKKWGTLLRLREWANQQCSAPGFRKACRLINARSDGDLDWRQARGVMSNWRSIRDSHQAGWVDQYAMSTHQRVRFLAGRGISAHFIPVGTYEEMGRELGLPRHRPVGFLGNIRHNRRVQMLQRLRERLEARGIPLVQVVDNCHGQARCEWLNRTRILVSVHNFSWNPAWIRFLLAAMCGTLVVSEPMKDEHPMVAGVHYVAADLDDMPEVICQLLNEPEKIGRITAAAADLCHRELTLLRAVEKLASLVTTHT